MSIEKRKGKKGRKEELRMWTGEETATWAKIGPILVLIIFTSSSEFWKRTVLVVKTVKTEL